MIPPKSCDTFAVLPPGTSDNLVVFGKNSDRPSDEVQEVVYFPAADYPPESKLKVTYIEIDQVSHTYATILSKPSWMWGAEMGANEHSVCIGNEAVWTKLNDDSDSIEKLLGMDLLRLGLERARSAFEALNTIVSLLEKYGMGGNCSDTIRGFTYHNSFLIADPYEVWILECAGALWAAEKITCGVRNISNELSIGTKIDMKSDNLENFAIENGFWSSEKGPLNFKLAFGLDEDEDESFRYKCGKRLLSQYSAGGKFDETSMFKVLRDKPSGICMSSGSFVSTGSQVSMLHKAESNLLSCHWFTGTPDPLRSLFKPFIFTIGIEYPIEIISPNCEINSTVDRKHKLYCHHQAYYKKNKRDAGVDQNIKDLEIKYVGQAKRMSNNLVSKQKDVAVLFKSAVEEELKAYE